MDVTEQIKNFEKFFENGSYKDYAEVDFIKLSKFDIDLADKLLEEPEETIKAAEIALDSLGYPKIQVLFYNLPESTKLPLNEISDQLGKFLTFEGYVMKPSDIHLKAKSARFECPSCGNIITVLMLGKEWREPSKCSCGRKGKFRLLSQQLIKFQRLEIQEALDSVPDKPRRLIKKKVFISENLTRVGLNQELQPGKRIRIHGNLELEELRTTSRFKTNEFRTNIVANNIIPIETSWESIKLGGKEIKKIKEMAEQKDILSEFAQSLSPSFEGYELIRKSLILQHVGGKRIFDSNGNLEERGIIHVILCGPPGSGKTYLMKRALVISPLWHWTQGAGLTKAGLVACVTKDEFGSYGLEIGPFVMADKGIIGIDEFEKVNKGDFGMLNNGMNDEQTKITKANIDQTLKTRTSVLAASNPLHKVFVDTDTILKQLAPVPKDILDRFDVIWAMRENIDQGKLEEKYMARHLKSESIKQVWTNDEMRNYIAYAKRLTPILNPFIAKFFNQKFKQLTGKTVDSSTNEKSHRLRGNIFRWVYAHAKFTGVGKENHQLEVEISKLSVDFAFNLIRKSFDMLELINKEGFAKFEDVEDIPSKKEINNYYFIRNTIKELSKLTKLIPYENILKEVQKERKDIDEDKLDSEIQRLKNVGEIFEPRRGEISLL